MHKSPVNDTDNSIVIHLRHVHFIIAGCLICLFFTFIIGYFWGKRTTYQELIHCYKEEAFADKINTSLCLFYDPLSLNDEDKDEIDKIEKIEEGSEE